jgi:heme/copper-type cytochrome/quinol oxidase subunit 4
MGYFDGLTASSFKKDAEGRDLFFIWGKLGKGRVVPTEADGAWVRQYLKNFYIVVIVAVVPMVLLGGEAFSPRWLLTIAIFMALALAALVPLWLRTREWPMAGERLTYRESMSASAKAHGMVSLSILVVLGIVLVAGSVFVLLYTDETLVGAFGVVFFGACLGLFLWMLRARRRG